MWNVESLMSAKHSLAGTLKNSKKRMLVWKLKADAQLYRREHAMNRIHDLSVYGTGREGVVCAMNCSANPRFRFEVGTASVWSIGNCASGQQQHFCNMALAEREWE